MCVKVYMYAHMKMFLTFHNSFMFLATSMINFYICIRVIMNRRGHHNIRNGIVWAQTGHSTGTCTATLLVIEL